MDERQTLLALAARLIDYTLQLLVFVHSKQQASIEELRPAPASLDILVGSEAGQLTDFIKSTVSIHSVLTDRIDHLGPSQQLTLKVAPLFQGTHLAFLGLDSWRLEQTCCADCRAACLSSRPRVDTIALCPTRVHVEVGALMRQALQMKCSSAKVCKPLGECCRSAALWV